MKSLSILNTNFQNSFQDIVCILQNIRMWNLVILKWRPFEYKYTLQSRDQKPYFQKSLFKKKADGNFRGNFLKNHFRHLKLYSNPPSWLARSRCHMGTFWKTKDWSSHFWEGQPFRFWYVEVHRQRRFKSTKTGISS